MNHKRIKDLFLATGHKTLPMDHSVTEASHAKSLSYSSDQLPTLKTDPTPVSRSSSAITTQTQAVSNTVKTAQSVTLTSAQNMLPTTNSCYPTHFKQGWAHYLSSE